MTGDDRRFLMYSRTVAASIRAFEEQACELVPIPWGERVRRVWRDKRLRHLWRSHDSRRVPGGAVFGVEVRSYVDSGGL